MKLIASVVKMNNKTMIVVKVKTGDLINLDRAELIMEQAKIIPLLLMTERMVLRCQLKKQSIIGWLTMIALFKKKQ